MADGVRDVGGKIRRVYQPAYIDQSARNYRQPRTEVKVAETCTTPPCAWLSAVERASEGKKERLKRLRAFEEGRLEKRG